MTTVRDLIEGLSMLDPDLPVYVPDGGEQYGSPTFSEVEQVSEGYESQRDYSKPYSHPEAHKTFKVVHIS